MVAGSFRLFVLWRRIASALDRTFDIISRVAADKVPVTDDVDVAVVGATDVTVLLSFVADWLWLSGFWSAFVGRVLRCHHGSFVVALCLGLFVWHMPQ